jgi:hypothetical protein
MCPSTETTGRIEAMALYAGESVTNVKDVRPAAEIVAELVSRAASADGREPRPSEAEQE